MCASAIQYPSPKLNKPNNSRVLEEDCRREIGILDIYGFERLERH